MRDDEPYELREPDRSLGDLVGELTGELGELVRTHLELARTEIRHDVREASKAGAMVGAGALSGLVALLLLSMAAAWGLAEAMAAGWAFLIVGGVWALIAAAMAAMGRSRLEAIEPAPRATVETIQEDSAWLKTQTP